jgi:lipoyl(octanoyl) transferase
VKLETYFTFETSETTMVISVVQLGQLDYATGLRLQQRLVEMRKAGEIGNVLLLLEHTPVITLGRNAKRTNVLASDDLLTERGVELFECDRGGDVTFHGPGQLVGYPIFDLRSFPSTGGKLKTLGAVDYVRRLEEVLIRSCADWNIAAARVPGMTGVWTDAGGGRSTSGGQAKIAAIGVHISRAITSHGFALNITNQPLDYFQLIVPCGITSKPVTSIERELESNFVAHAPTRVLTLDDVAHDIARNFGRVFDSQIVWVDTLEALLGRKIGVPARAPEELRKLTGEKETFWT